VLGALIAAAFTAWNARSAGAQLIPVKTVPLATGNQFLVAPSSLAGLAGAGLALDDTLGGAFSNPALGHLSESRFFGAPVHFGISGDGGGGSTLPLGAHLTGQRWFGSVLVALQQLSAGGESFGASPWCEFSCPFTDGSRELRSSAARNVYLFGSVGRQIQESTWIGLSTSYADLRWMSGIERLYAGATRVAPEGGVLNLRGGLHHRWNDGREVRVAAIHERVDMRHDVLWVDFLWPPVDPLVDWVPIPTVREEENLDRTRTWGAEVNYRVPVTGSPWTLATSATLNRKDHPKIPNYQIQNIPRDPGETWAFGLGLGAARTQGSTTFAADVHVQPIWSETWQEADTAQVGPAGLTIAKGGRTIENDFRFTNLTLQLGVDQQLGRGEVQFGLEARSIGYTLDQVNRVQATRRRQSESWIEWSPTLALGFDLDALQLRYVGRLTTGTGRPGIQASPVFDRLESAAPGIDILAAPSGALTLEDARVWTHQVVVSLPVR